MFHCNAKSAFHCFPYPDLGCTRRSPFIFGTVPSASHRAFWGLLTPRPVLLGAHQYPILALPQSLQQAPRMRALQTAAQGAEQSPVGRSESTGTSAELAGKGSPGQLCTLVAPVWHPRRLARWRNLLCSRTASCASQETRGCNPFPLPPHALLLPDFFRCLCRNNGDKTLILRDTQT